MASCVSWIPDGASHVLIRLLLAIPKLNHKHRLLVVDMFAIFGLVVHAGNHHPNLSCLEIAGIAKAKSYSFSDY